MSCEIASAAAGHPGGGASSHTLCRLSPLLPVLVLIRHIESGWWEGAVLLLVGFIAFLYHAYMHTSFSCQFDLGPQVELGKHVGPKLGRVCGERCFGQHRSQPQLTFRNRKSKSNRAVHPVPKVENLLQSTHPKCGTKSVLNSVEKQNENGKGISMVWNKVFFLLWVLLARLKPGWINFLECFLLILPPVHSITVCRLPYLLTCLQCIIHHYVMYPWLNAEYQIHPAQQWISVKCADLIMQVQYAMRQKRQLCKVCTPQIIPRNAWYSWVEYYHIPCIDFQPRAQENKAKVLYLSDPVDLILDLYWLLSAWMCSPYRIYFKTKLNLYKQLWDRWRRVRFADMEQSLHISELPLELCHVYVKRPGEELLRKCAAMPTHAQGRYCS